jgi:hypothetical protein
VNGLIKFAQKNKPPPPPPKAFIISTLLRTIAYVLPRVEANPWSPVEM